MSIRQNSQTTRLPDFGNLGVMLRVLLAVNLLALCAALARNADLARLPQELVELAAMVEPPLIAAVVLLYAAGKWLGRLPYGAALAVVAAGFAQAADGGRPDGVAHAAGDDLGVERAFADVDGAGLVRGIAVDHDVGDTFVDDHVILTRFAQNVPGD